MRGIDLGAMSSIPDSSILQQDDLRSLQKLTKIWFWANDAIGNNDAALEVRAALITDRSCKHRLLPSPLRHCNFFLNLVEYLASEVA